MRLTENAIMVTATGEIAYVKLSPHPEATTGHKKIREVVLAATGTLIPIGEVSILAITDLASLNTFVTAFNGLNVKARSGYSQYFNDHGVTNPESPRELATQGILKVITPFLNVLHERSAKGDIEARKALALVDEYNDVNTNNILAMERQKMLDIAAANFTPDEIAQAQQSRLEATVQTASVEIEEASEVEVASEA